MQDTELFREVVNVSLADAADRLRMVADALEKGEIELGAHTFTFPENVTFNIELEERHDADLPPINFGIEFEILWPMPLHQGEE